MKREENKRVLLGMSGGTDSSVSAMLLQQAGYEVIGVTFRFYELNGSQEYLEDARALANRLGIEHITYDAREVFKEKIVDYFVNEYLQGKTPVPCTLCNNYLKWPLLAKLADEMDIFHIATGHYVRKTYVEGNYYIIPGVDPDKDQSFFLWGVPQSLLERMLLPMGDVTKTWARAFAAERGFTKVSTKKDSLGVCFCPMDYRTFLKQSPLYQSAAIAKGKFLDEKGEFIAMHDGYPFYTIGQRRGLGIDLNKAVFVKEIHPERNEVVLGDLASLEKRVMWLDNWHAIDEEKLLSATDLIVKIRYRKQLNHCKVSRTDDNRLRIELTEPLTAVANGQAAAFYQGELLVGGGIIVDSAN